MRLQYRTNYNDFSDKELVEKIIRPPHNEEAAAFLLHDRYNPLLKSVYQDLTMNFSWFDDCVSDLFIHLKGKACDWRPHSTFQWRSSLGCWLGGVARNNYVDELIW